MDGVAVFVLFALIILVIFYIFCVAHILNARMRKIENDIIVFMSVAGEADTRSRIASKVSKRAAMAAGMPIDVTLIKKAKDIH